MVILYDGAYYAGRSIRVTCDTGALGSFNDKASSARVLGKIELLGSLRLL